VDAVAVLAQAPEDGFLTGTVLGAPSFTKSRKSIITRPFDAG
jgi:hypothetical protein